MKRIVLIALTLLSALALTACVVNPNIYATPIAKVHTGYPSASPEVVSAMPSESSPADLTNQTGSGTIGSYAVKIVSFELTKEAGEKDGPSVAVTYEWTNNSGKATGFSLAIQDKVCQDGADCEAAGLTGADNNNPDTTNDIDPGSTQTVQRIYRLNDTVTPIDIVLSELLSLEKVPPTVKQTFEIG